MVCPGSMACMQLMGFWLVGSLLCCQCFLSWDFSSGCQGREGKRIFSVLMRFFWLFLLESVFLDHSYIFSAANWIMEMIYSCHFWFFQWVSRNLHSFLLRELTIFIVITWLLNSALKNFAWTKYLEMITFWPDSLLSRFGCWENWGKDQKMKILRVYSGFFS